MNFSNIEAALVRGGDETGSTKKIKGELICGQCRTTKILEVEVQDNHTLIYFYLCSLNFHGVAPNIWMNPRLDERCPSCRRCYMDPKPATSEKNINWHFLYLIEALGYLSLDELNYYCKKNYLRVKGDKEKVLFQVFHHMSNKFQGWLSIHREPNSCKLFSKGKIFHEKYFQTYSHVGGVGKTKKIYDSFDDTEAQNNEVLIAQGKWSYLPQELLQLIFECPTMDVADLQRCHDVCVSWRSVAKKLLAYKECPPMLPPLLYFPNKTSSCCKPSSSYTNATEFYRLGFPFTYCGRLFMYSSHGWLLSVGEDILSRDLQLLNPFSGVKIQLPDEPTDLSRPYKFILSASPCNSDCIIVLLCRSKLKLAFCRPGDDSWKLSKHNNKEQYEDLIFFGNHLRIVKSDGCLRTFLVDKFKLRTFPHPIRIFGHCRTTCQCYLVETSCGDLLMVLRHVLWKKESLNTSIYKTISFEVVKLEEHEKEWSKVSSLGKQTLFLSHNDSRIVSASDPAVCKRNCIYFVDDSMEGYCMSRGTDFGVYDMKNKTIERFCSVPFNRWFKPDI